jgi:hypothetical protein
MQTERQKEKTHAQDEHERKAEFIKLHGDPPEDPYAPAYSFNGFHIPQYMMGGIIRYISEGIPPGDFLKAVITNNLRDAIGRADDFNLRNLPAYPAFFYNKAPGLCWGNQERMEKWIEFGGDMKRLLGAKEE